jgi:hypothetical protein
VDRREPRYAGRAPGHVVLRREGAEEFFDVLRPAGFSGCAERLVDVLQGRAFIARRRPELLVH